MDLDIPSSDLKKVYELLPKERLIEKLVSANQEARVIAQAGYKWGELMYELLGENRIEKVRTAIVRLKEQNQLTLTERDRDNLCDIVWWLKGYKKGNDNSFNGCDFNEHHLDSLDKTVRELRTVLNKKP
jgi:hypothetical protein